MRIIIELLEVLVLLTIYALVVKKLFNTNKKNVQRSKDNN